MKPDFIGIGAPKSATSWLFKCLQDHPETSMYESKGTNFFCSDDLFKKGGGYYESLFKDCDKGKVVGEFSPAYLSTDGVPKRIKNIVGGCKLLVSLRNPIERSKSDIRHLFSQGNISGTEKLSDIVSKYPKVIEKSYYGKHLGNYIDLFGRENILILYFNNIVSSPELVIKRVYNFLQIDEHHKPNFIDQKYNSSQSRCSFLFDFFNKLYWVLKDHRLGQQAMFFLKKLGINSLFVHKISAVFSNENFKNMKIEDTDLYHFLKSDIEELEIILEKDLSHWKL